MATQQGLINFAARMVSDVVGKAGSIRTETVSDLEIIDSGVDVVVGENIRNDQRVSFVWVSGCGIGMRNRAFYGDKVTRAAAMRSFIRRNVQRAWDNQERKNNGK